MSSESERKRQRYAEDPEFRAKVLATNKAWHEANTDQVKEARRQKRAENPEAKPKNPSKQRLHDPAAQRESTLKCLYGMSTADYDAMLAQQHGTCAICRTKPPDQTLAVDHSHVTERVRGLLCRDCNLGLGNFKDDPRLTRRAYEYLEAFLARCAAEADQTPQTGPPDQSSPEHDPEKWMPVFGERSCSSNKPLPGRVGELIDAALEGVIERRRLAVGKRQELHQDHAGDAAPRIEPDVGVVGAAPAQAAGGPLAQDGVGGNQKAEAPLVAPVGDE
jgi:hypothetical protein